jgi:L-lactate dehydrogenase complex protein LldF
MKINTHKFHIQARAAINNQPLQQALSYALSHILSKRNRAFEEFAEAELLRDRARKIKEHTLAQLNSYLLQLEEGVLKAGGNVYWARKGKDALKYIARLVEQKGARIIVKGKSMVSEEIGLNEFLAKRGLEVVETDLGEYIVQLAGEKPSHIIAPAIHKSKEEVALLFKEKLGIDSHGEISKLTKAARDKLKEKFFQADIGITGANFAVAQTGTIVLLENEGNIRFTTTLPPVHIVLLGIEKVIPTLIDLAVFLQLLPRSATGQKLPSYISLITGPKKRGEQDGPEELHVIILDNGRSKILSDQDLRESLYCLRCGACLNICPVYQKLGGHTYGWVYSGPIGSVITPLMIGLYRARALPYASTLCGACRDICPVKIDIPHMLLKLREQLTEHNNKRFMNPGYWLERFFIYVWASAMKGEKRYRLASRIGRRIQTPFQKDHKIPYLPFPFSRWTKARDFPPLAPETFRDWWEREKGAHSRNDTQE